MAYRSIIQLNIISDEPIPNNITLDEIMNSCDDGKYIGTYKSILRNQKIETWKQFFKNIIKK